MKGAFLLALDPGLFEQAASVLVALGGERSPGDIDRVVQMPAPAGRFFTLFADLPPETVWEVREGPFEILDGVVAPDMSLVHACPFECADEVFASDIVARIAEATDSVRWILDGDGVLWDAATVDPAGLRL
ncbi:hypothetical protein QE370_003267 [Aeromicrobium sp. SORGH_AS981]|uniref:hypothetical protein n=1 Tax=Aeromicrobium sp. SORGH_AS_0981 TaxID=3041802 RepID=UPI0028607C67|nr:hypothetical protein [Aeromicrobium sp. SORGH_AS_0981]MDR6120083.1 hypothetical protein [Aeromicrobium sp. SORGH_AS_0981]